MSNHKISYDASDKELNRIYRKIEKEIRTGGYIINIFNGIDDETEELNGIIVEIEKE